MRNKAKFDEMVIRIQRAQQSLTRALGREFGVQEQMVQMAHLYVTLLEVFSDERIDNTKGRLAVAEVMETAMKDADAARDLHRKTVH